MSLWGCETEDDCRRETDKLLAMLYHAQATMTRTAVEALKSRLKELYKRQTSQANKDRMSDAESAYFSAAVHHAYVHAPHLSSPNTWNDALSEMELDLKYNRPKEVPKEEKKEIKTK
jgi:hypothetical protein